MKAYPRDVTVQTMKKRHIGVENELLVRRPVSEFQSELSKRGLLHSIGHDGGGREFRTNPISVHTLNQVRGHKYLCDYYEELGRHTSVISSGGTHIHISILETDHPNMESNATAMAIAFHKQFQKISGRNTTWARRLDCRTLSAVRDRLVSCKYNPSYSRQGSRTYSRMGVMLSPTYHQTLEFRGPKGSNDKNEILAWIEFLNNVVKRANRNSVEGTEFKVLLKGDRISAYVDSLPKSRRFTEEELNQKFNSAELY
jgi:hypothetical protein